MRTVQQNFRKSEKVTSDSEKNLNFTKVKKIQTSEGKIATCAKSSKALNS